MNTSLVPLSGRLALVTGASGNIGSAIAHRLARDGAHVIVHYHSTREGAEAIVREIHAAGGEAEAIWADLALADGAVTLIRLLDSAFAGRFAGRLDVLINNAGTMEIDTLTDVSDESFDRMFNINVRACFQLSREAARRMKPAGWGRIINIGSVFGESAPAAGLSIYCGTKFAVRGLTRAWSRDLGTYGITVNNVQPALIHADPLPTSGPLYDALERFSSVGRFGKPAEIADAVAFLASPNSGYVNGESLTVDGGWSA